MSMLILCQKKTAQVPFSLENAAVRIFTLEEVCYFIRENMDLAQKEFMREEFLIWLTKELCMPSLAQRLELYWRRKNVDLFMESLLKASGYLTQDEIKEVCHGIHEIQNLTPIQYEKIMADRLVQNGMYAAAVQKYRTILTLEEIRREKPSFKGKVWNNLGTAYSRMFLFEEAMLCYEQAENYLELTEFHREYWVAGYFAYGEKEVYRRMLQKQIPEKEIKQFLMHMQAKEEAKEEDEELFALEQSRQSGEINEFYQNADRILQKWKERYVQGCVF